MLISLSVFTILLILGLIIKRSRRVLYSEFSTYPELDDFKKQFEKIAKITSLPDKHGKGIDFQPVKKYIDKAYKIIKRKVYRGEELYEFERWLYDNNYMFKNIMKDGITDDFFNLPHNGKVPRVIIFARALVALSKCKIDSDRFNNALKSFYKYSELTYFEIANIENAIKYALLEKIADISKKSIYYNKVLKIAIKSKNIVKKYANSNLYLYYTIKRNPKLSSKLNDFLDENCKTYDNIDYTFSALIVENNVLISGLVESLQNIGQITSLKYEIMPSYRMLSNDDNFLKCDEFTKNVYLEQIGRLSDEINITECEFAKRLLTLSNKDDVFFGNYLRKSKKEILKCVKNNKTIICKKSKLNNSFLYVFCNVLIIVLLSCGVGAVTYNLYPSVVLSVLGTFGFIYPAGFLTDKIFGLFVKPNPVRRIKINDIPDDQKTEVIMPLYISNKEELFESVKNICSISEANKFSNLRFTLLIDFKKSNNLADNSDNELINILKDIKYDNVNAAVRKRIKISDGVYSGREKKRGAIEDYVCYLKTNNKDNFLYIKNELITPKYFIVIDNDDKLYPQSVLKAVGTFMHPENEFRDLLCFSAQSNLFSINNFYATRYLYSAGREQYPEYSDFSYKLTNTSLYCGKGMFKLDSYYEKLYQKLPENKILSHDILEGALLNTGSLGLSVYEDVPNNFTVDENRRLRWGRGDIQLLPFSNIKKSNGKMIDVYQRYTMFKNALSMFYQPYVLILFLVSAILQNYPLAIFAGVIYSSDFLLSIPELLVASMTNRRFFFCFKEFLMRIFLLIEKIALLPYYAFVNIGLYALTVYRMFISKKGLLNWKPFAVKTYETIKNINEKDRETLLNYAKDIYLYFDNIQGLVPDHFTEYPDNRYCDYTSPTDIAFQLLSEACAYKLNFKTYDEAEEKTQDILSVALSLKKWNGHLYNWYDINTKKPLFPYFVSSVDSGNFIASLLVIKECFGKNINNLIEKYLKNVDFSSLFDKNMQLFYIGYNEKTDKYEGHYDNLMSEARLLSYVAISQGVSSLSWDNLCRRYTSLCHNTMMSWGGTCFEYLMCDLFLSLPKNSDLYCTSKNVVKVMKRGGCKGFWGISESGYFDFDNNGNYLYRAFGQDNLSLKSEFSKCVISPYSSFLALKYNKNAVLKNLKRLEKFGAYGRFGFFESVDFQSSPRIVLEYMAHHLGMSLTAVTNYLLNDEISKTFENNLSIFGAKQLLCDRRFEGKTQKPEKNKYLYNEKINNDFEYNISENYAKCQMNIIGNVDYSVLLDDYGCGYSKYKYIWLNRFENDLSKTQGVFFYVKCDDEIFSPTRAVFNDNDKYRTVFRKKEAEYINETRGISQKVIVADFTGCEIRRLKIENNGKTSKKYSIYFYTDLCLNNKDAYFSHPAYSNLFVESEVQGGVLICKRRSKEKNIGAYCALISPKGSYYVSNRYNARGRLHDVDNLNILKCDNKNADDNGTVIDCCLSSVTNIEIERGESVTLDYFILLNDNLDKLQQDINRAKNPLFCEYMAKIPRIIEQNNGDNIDNKNTKKMLKLIPKLLYTPYSQEKLYNICKYHNIFSEYSQNYRKKILLFVYDKNNYELKQATNIVKLLLSAGISVSMIVSYREDDGYYTPIKREIMNDIKGLTVGRDVFLCCDILPDILCKIAFYDFSEIEDNFELTETLKIEYSEKTDFDIKPILKTGEGMFSKEGYNVIPLNNCTLLPYSNVICGQVGGTIVTADGGGYTYYGNSRESKLTVFSNDFTEDSQSEWLLFDNGNKIYDLLRGAKYTHNFGITQSQFEKDKMHFSVSQYILNDGGIKIYDVLIESDKDIKGKLILNLNLALGSSNDKTYIYYKNEDDIYEAINLKTGISCYLYSKDAIYLDTLYRRGRNGKIFCASMENTTYSASVEINLQKGKNKRIYFAFGGDFKSIYNVKNTLLDNLKDTSIKYFENLNPFEINTGNLALDILFNKMLPYQIMSSRINGRCGFYQTGGAVGFRDMLQDLLYLIYQDEKRARKIILDIANHTYFEGDVMHWWHKDRQGVRTKISDDKLFLPFIVCEYIEKTNDFSILDEKVNYLDSKTLSVTEESRYEIPEIHKNRDTLLLHIERIMDNAYKTGENGLLLIGGGDWNDALNNVGNEKSGESVWLTQFYVYVAKRLITLYDGKEKIVFIDRIKKLSENILKTFENGQFKRLVTSGGEWLGDGNNKKFLIDIISQAWGTLSGIGDKNIQESALLQVKKHLIDKENGLILLLYPPLDDKSYYGYINLYPKGIRENGGQYTHGAVWYLYALLLQGRADEAFDLFQMINPLKKCIDIDNVKKYKGEPYVLSADVYSNNQHKGRAGWSWYTGSASWCYKLILEGFFGIVKKGDTLELNINPPKIFDKYTVKYKYKSSLYTFNFKRGGKFKIVENGVEISGCNTIQLKDNETRAFDVLY